MTRRKCLWLLLGPLLGLAVPDLLLRNSTAYWRYAASLRPGGAAPAEALLRLTRPGQIELAIVGSSVALGDVNEKLLDRGLEPLRVRSLNLGVQGAPACATAMLIRPVIALAPRLILLVLSPDALRGNDPVARVRVYDPLVALRIFGGRSLLEDRGFHLAGTLGWANVLCRHREELRKDFLEGRDELFRTHPRDLPRLRGRVLESRLQTARARAAELRLDGDGPNVEGVRFMARASRQAGIRLVACPAPSNPLLYEEAAYREMELLIEKLAAEEGFVRLAGRDLGAYGAEDFMDPAHLAPPAQRRYTAAVAESLRPLLAGGADALQ